MGNIPVLLKWRVMSVVLGSAALCDYVWILSILWGGILN